ncbi:MAG TPA: hypothetical protein VJH23_03710 [archaeon]|nr:hypothetical protein [archaeon]
MKSEKSLFVKFFGDYPAIRVIDFLLENDVFDYSKRDICRNSGVSWNTLETFWKNLEEAGIVEGTRRVGKAEMYRINSGSAVVKQLSELDKRLVRKSMEKIGAQKAAAYA